MTCIGRRQKGRQRIHQNHDPVPRTSGPGRAGFHGQARGSEEGVGDNQREGPLRPQEQAVRHL